MSGADQRMAFCTVVTFNHVHHARVLAESLHQAHPAAPLYICVVDRPTQAVDVVPDNMCTNASWLYGDELEIEDWKRFVFQYSAFEMCCALKPYVMQHVLRLGHPSVIYLDADIRVYSPLVEIFEGADEMSVGLTPHLLEPIPWDGKFPDERTILSAGVYNGGFLAVTATGEGHRFLDWWQDRLADKCVIDIANAMFVDQKWLDLVPALFEHVRIHRRPGFHVAYWNLLHARMERSAHGPYLFNGQPLALIHFSGIDIHCTRTMSKHQDRLSLEEYPLFAELLAAYVEDLQAADAENLGRQPYGFNHLTDGTPIDPSWRTAIRTCHPALAEIDDPFDVSATRALLQRLRRAGLDLTPFVGQERDSSDVILPFVPRSLSILRHMGRRVRSALFTSEGESAQDVDDRKRSAPDAWCSIHRKVA